MRMKRNQPLHLQLQQGMGVVYLHRSALSRSCASDATCFFCAAHVIDMESMPGSACSFWAGVNFMPPGLNFT